MKYEPVLLLALACACTVERPRNVGEARAPAPVEDDWKPSALWLYATPSVAGGPDAECAQVLRVLGQEKGCRGAFCRRGAELAVEWAKKCGKRLPAQVAEVRTLYGQLSRSAARAPSDCAKELDRTLNGCENGACAEPAQRWATDCAEASGSPLALAILQQAADRANDEGTHVALDGRSCTTLRASLAEDARCAGEDECKKAWPTAEAHRRLCLRKDRPPLLDVAVAEAVIADGAQRDEEPPSAVSPMMDRLPDGALPLQFADGSGAVLRVCNKKPADLAGYLALRDECQGSELKFVRIAIDGDSASLKRGRLFLPLPLPLADALPALLLAGESDRDEERAAAAVAKDLDSALALPADQATAALMRLFDASGAWIARSDKVRSALHAKDAAVAPALARIAEAKVKAGRAMKDVANLRGLVFRARTRPFADVGPDGAIHSGAPTRAFRFEAQAVWPEAMRAYTKALAPLLKVHVPQPAPADVAVARSFARDEAGACVTARAKVAAAQEKLLQCAFDSDCNEGRQGGLFGDLQLARSDFEGAVHRLDIAASVLGQTAAAAGAAQGCDPDK